MRKSLSVNYLNKLGACPEAVEMFKNQNETNPVKIIQGTMKINHFDWANWLIARLMTRKQNLQYAIFAAESVINIYEKGCPNDKRPRNAIEATNKVLKYNSKKNRADAAYAADAADAASAAAYDAAYNAASAYAYAASAAAASAAAYDAAYAYASAASAAASAASARKNLQKKIIYYGIKLLRDGQ